jgi:hypothetical protein
MKILKLFFILVSSQISSLTTYKITINQNPDNLATASSYFVQKTYLPILLHVTIVKAISPENSRQFSDTFTSFIKNFSRKFTFQLEDASTLKPTTDRRRSNLMFIDTLASFNAICTQINHHNFKMRKLFTVISIAPLTESEMNTIFDCFMDRLVIDANIIAPDANDTVSLFTFFPYRSAVECGNRSPIKINSFSNGRWSHEKFYYRRSNDLMGCPLHIGAAAVAAEPAVMLKKGSSGALKLTGIEKDVFMELAHRLNFTANFLIYNESVGSVYENGTGKGVLLKVLKNEVDAAIGFASLQYERTMFMSETKAYAMHSMAMISKLMTMFMVNAKFMISYCKNLNLIQFQREKNTVTWRSCSDPSPSRSGPSSSRSSQQHQFSPSFSRNSRQSSTLSSAVP